VLIGAGSGRRSAREAIDLSNDEGVTLGRLFTAKFVSPTYIQHNPLIADGSVALGKFFAHITRERARARVVVHRIIAVGDYVWAHVNFLNLFNDDLEDTGIAGVDIYKMDADGKAIEHWDTLQIVGDPKNSAPLIAPNIPRANANGMF
jgi:predicted SnoaL-like aldol condensation-catalyzing enzyme